MNEHEEKFISAFILKEYQERYRFLLNSFDSRRRNECTNRLNHCRDLNPKYTAWLSRNPRGTPARNEEIVELLLQKGSPKLVYVLSCNRSVDGQTIPILEALNKTDREGWGTIVSCIAGELAYYFD